MCKSELIFKGKYVLLVVLWCDKIYNICKTVSVWCGGLNCEQKKQIEYPMAHNRTSLMQ